MDETEEMSQQSASEKAGAKKQNRRHASSIAALSFAGCRRLPHKNSAPTLLFKQSKKRLK